MAPGEAYTEQEAREALQQVEVPAEEREEARRAAAVFAQQAAFDVPAYLAHLQEARHKQRELESQLLQLQGAPEAARAARAAYAARRHMLLDERILRAITVPERRKVEAAAAAALKGPQGGSRGGLLAAAEVAEVAARCGAEEGVVQQCLAQYVRFRSQAGQWRAWSEQMARGVVTQPPGMPRSAAGVSSLPAEMMGAGGLGEVGQDSAYDPIASLMPGMMEGMQGLEEGALGGGDEGGDEVGRQMRAAAVRLLEERKAAQAHSAGRKVRRPAWGGGASKGRKGQK